MERLRSISPPATALSHGWIDTQPNASIGSATPFESFPGRPRSNWSAQSTRVFDSALCRTRASAPTTNHHYHACWRLDFDTAGNNVVREFNDPPLVGTSNWPTKSFETRPSATLGASAG
jgi:hypothetical protein